MHFPQVSQYRTLTVDFSDDVKLGDTEKNIIALKVRGGHGV